MTKFLSYGSQWVDEDDIDAVLNILKGDFLTQGPKLVEFEKSICDYTGAQYCIAVSSGTAALHLAVASLDIEAESEGITTPNTFVATANALVYNHIRPIFADIDPRTYCIDTQEIDKRINSRTRLIIPVHFAGQPCLMEDISQSGKHSQIKIIEDASHALGSKYADGSRVGNCKYADLTVFSFHPVKNITSAEGGAITTNDRNLFKKLQRLRNHGITKDSSQFFHLGPSPPGPWYYEMQDLGFNYRLSDIHAALGLSQMKKLDVFAKRRREIVNEYNRCFKVINWLTIPYEDTDVDSCFHLYVLQLDFNQIGRSRSEVIRQLRENQIGTQVHYIPVHTQPYYIRNFGYHWGDYPEAEKYYQKALSIPLFPKMDSSQVKHVIENILKLKK